ncbi:hypothetical protein DFJ73DRAFT_619935 [Zopfochytrium polystomum]|nr:hypothetical protein DFJ73DRAFT_619935 [Zopfochytrium polystomum]
MAASGVVGAGPASLQSLKDSLLSTDQNGEERVEVNQRHLIDKILARYSADNTIFRELLQNSNDAGASAAEIHFKTDPSLRSPPSLRDAFFKKAVANVKTVVYKNNGRPFAGEDWGRLKKIAEGNPDEQKIGFFGVGFYSLFSICEEPFVTSGNECMAFFWKGKRDQLFTKKGPVAQESVSEWTTFYLSLRDPIECPNITDFGRFLATSLTFTRHLKKIEVFIDDDRVLLLDKKSVEPRPLEFPKHLYTLTSPNSIFHLNSISMSKVQLDITVRTNYDKDRGKSGQDAEFSTFMRTCSAKCDVRLNPQMAREMERTTKKKAPPTTEIHIQFSNYDELEGSTTNKTSSPILENLVPTPKEQGRVFIGFATHQSTGCSMNLAGHLIPTVERESIDFVDRTLNIYNQDLLSIGGLLARIVFEDEMSSIGSLYKELTLDEQSELWLQKKAAHAMAAFTFRPSTPSNLVGRIHSLYFTKLCKNPLSVLSTKGVLPVSSVRLPNEKMKDFIKEIPVFPSEVMTNCVELVRELDRNGTVHLVDLGDLLVELEKRVLSADEVKALIKWWIAYRKANAVTGTEMKHLFQLLVITDPANLSSPPKPAADFKFHVNNKIIPPNVPIPENALPMEISKAFSKEELEEAFRYGMRDELTIPEWLNFVTGLTEFQNSPAFVEKIMGVVSRQFGSLQKNVQATIVQILSGKNCIVSRQGLKKPGESYFKNVTLFDDLPIVMFEKGVNDQFLKALGVRDYVDLQIVFSRLADLKWDSDHVQLIKYLTSVQDKLTQNELERLRLTSVFTKEEPQLPSGELKRKRFKAAELYAPSETLRALGVPILDWPGKVKWRNGSDEAKFMLLLGLKTVIPWRELVESAALTSPEIRSKFLAYFIDNWKTYVATGYTGSAVLSPFLPSSKDPTMLYKPSQLFADPTAAVMDFPVLHAELKQHADKFGVREHPTGAQLIAALRQNPPNLENAKSVFGYLAGRQSAFSSSDWVTLQTLKFIPIPVPNATASDGKGPFDLVHPTSVYFGSSSTSMYKDLFTYIDFGNPSNAFLRACGVKDEPSPLDLAEQVVRAPQTFMDQLGFQKYMQVLRTIAANYYMLSKTPIAREMRNSAFLIGLRTEPERGSGADKSDGPETVDGGDGERFRYELAPARDICLIDDTVLNQLFSPLGAPMESLLEEMYGDLGSQWLSKQVTEVTAARGQPIRTQRTTKLQALIHERALLLLYDGQQIRGNKDIVRGAEQTLKTLEVVEVPEIMIERTFRNVTKNQPTTSCIKMDKNSRKYYLFITSQEGEVDYFDVAQALGKIIFVKSRLNDSLLLSTLLSTSLLNLKRKGFPVDRILNLQEAKLKAAAALLEAERQAKLSEARSANSAKTSTSSLPTAAVTPATPERSVAASPPFNDTPPSAVAAAAKQVTGAPGAWPNSPSPKQPGKEDDIYDTVNKFVKQSWLGDFLGIKDAKPKPAEQAPLVPSSSSSVVARPPPPRSTSTNDKSFRAQIPQDDELSADPALMAAKALAEQRYTCAPLAESDLLFAETLDGGMPLYVDGRALEESQQTVAANRKGLADFAAVLRLLGAVFEIEPAAFNVYWDKKGGTVAFNRGRTLFFNLRFYLGLHHDPQRRSGVPAADCFYYWFMVACHELAHNFVGEHNSQHEFYFSSFAENYLTRLTSVLKANGIEP